MWAQLGWLDHLHRLCGQLLPRPLPIRKCDVVISSDTSSQKLYNLRNRNIKTNTWRAQTSANQLINQSTFEWLRERTEHLDIFISAHDSIVFYFRCSVYWWKGASDFSVLKYYSLNINYLVNILNECLCILIDCSQLSKTYYNVLFGSSTRDRHAQRYISADIQRITLNT